MSDLYEKSKNIRDSRLPNTSRALTFNELATSYLSTLDQTGRSEFLAKDPYEQRVELRDNLLSVFRSIPGINPDRFENFYGSNKSLASKIYNETKDALFKDTETLRNYSKAQLASQSMKDMLNVSDYNDRELDDYVKSGKVPEWDFTESSGVDDSDAHVLYDPQYRADYQRNLSEYGRAKIAQMAPSSKASPREVAQQIYETAPVKTRYGDAPLAERYGHRVSYANRGGVLDAIGGVTNMFHLPFASQLENARREGALSPYGTPRLGELRIFDVTTPEGIRNSTEALTQGLLLSSTAAASPVVASLSATGLGATNYFSGSEYPHRTASEVASGALRSGATEGAFTAAAPFAGRFVKSLRGLSAAEAAASVPPVPRELLAEETAANKALETAKETQKFEDVLAEGSRSLYGKVKNGWDAGNLSSVMKAPNTANQLLSTKYGIGNFGAPTPVAQFENAMELESAYQAALSNPETAALLKMNNITSKEDYLRAVMYYNEAPLATGTMRVPNAGNWFDRQFPYGKRLPETAPTDMEKYRMAQSLHSSSKLAPLRVDALSPMLDARSTDSYKFLKQLLQDEKSVPEEFLKLSAADRVRLLDAAFLSKDPKVAIEFANKVYPSKVWGERILAEQAPLRISEGGQAMGVKLYGKGTMSDPDVTQRVVDAERAVMDAALKREKDVEKAVRAANIRNSNANGGLYGISRPVVAAYGPANDPDIREANAYEEAVLAVPHPEFEVDFFPNDRTRYLYGIGKALPQQSIGGR